MAAWKSSVSFSDRLATISSITSAYSRISPTDDYSVGHGEGTRIEAQAFNDAISKEDYHERCQLAIDELEAKALHPDSTKAPEEDEGVVDAEFESQNGVKIGHYAKAVHDADGLFSTIYKSKNESGLLVALKVTTPHMMAQPHDSEREARVLDKIKHNRSSDGDGNGDDRIIELLESFYDPGRRFVLVFPYMPYQLDRLLETDTLTTRQVRSHLADLFRGIEHVHSHGIIHRDIKPSNILLRSISGPAYLGDFGIVWAPGDKGSEDADDKIIDVGTTCYRPPEILFGCKNYDCSFDMWAAGCVVAEAIDPNHKQLFDAGPLGSELALIHSMFTTLGTPDLETWPSAKELPDWGKIEFQRYPTRPWDEILGGVSAAGRELVRKLVCYESRDRLSATEVLKHPYFSVER